MPRGTNQAIKNAAAKKYAKPSEYIRAAVMAALERDGFRPVPLPNEAA